VIQQAPTVDIDPELPELPVAFDLAAVSRLFAERWPRSEALSGLTSVTAHKLLDTKYEPHVSCVTTYDLEVAIQGGPPVRTIGTFELRPAQMVLRTLEQDPQLPWIVDAVDAEAMRRRFASSLPYLVGPAGAPPQITVVRYKPGARCVLRYTFDEPSGRRVLFGKMIAADSGPLANNISALQQESSRVQDMPLIAGPVAYWPDLRMLVQRAVEGSELHTVAFDTGVDVAARQQWMGKAGRGLAGLHSATGAGAPTRDIPEDADELDAYTAPMAQADRDLASSFAGAVESVRANYERAGSSLVASHGAFRTDQFMIQGDELVMIDLDSFCMSHPERDIGNLLAYLTWKAMRQPQHASFIEGAPKHFLHGYAAVRSAPDESRITLYEAASLLKIAGRRFRSLTVREWPKVPQLITAAQRKLSA
jgi:hypothetical protein